MWYRFNPKYVRMNNSKIMTMLPREIVCSGNAFAADKFYRIPISPKYVMAKVPSYKFSYEPETILNKDARECDDSVRIFRGWLSKKGFGNLLAMDTEVLLPNGIRHNLISFMNLDMEDEHGKHPLIFGEPQTGKVISSSISDKYTYVKLRL